MDRTARFCSWFSSEALRLRSLSLDAASDEIVVELKKVDSRLALELGDLGQFRELVLTAAGEPELFPLVRRIKEGFGVIPAWLFTALKPARGFKFVVATCGGGRLEASELFFDPLETNEVPPSFGIRVFVPPEVAALDDAQWLLRLAIEAGVGEESSAYVSYLEAAPLSETPEDALPIEVLGAFIVRHKQGSRQ